MLTEALGTCHRLLGLNLSDNQLGGSRGLAALFGGARAAPARVPSHLHISPRTPLHSLRSLLLSGNPSLGDEGARTVAASIKSLAELQVRIPPILHSKTLAHPPTRSTSPALRQPLALRSPLGRSRRAR